MITTLSTFFYMNGHGWYIWSAYGSVFILLAMQWFIPWRRWRAFLRMNQHIKKAAQVIIRNE